MKSAKELMDFDKTSEMDFAKAVIALLDSQGPDFLSDEGKKYCTIPRVDDHTGRPDDRAQLIASMVRHSFYKGRSVYFSEFTLNKLIERCSSKDDGIQRPFPGHSIAHRMHED